MAHRDQSRRCYFLVAIGGIADIGVRWSPEARLRMTNADIEGPGQTISRLRASCASFYARPKFGSIPCRLAAAWGRIEWSRKLRRAFGRKPGFSSPIRARIMAFADRIEAALKARGFEPLIDRTEILLSPQRSCLRSSTHSNSP